MLFFIKPNVLLEIISIQILDVLEKYMNFSFLIFDSQYRQIKFNQTNIIFSILILKKIIISLVQLHTYFSKIFEIAIVTQLTSFFIRFNLFFSSQHGYLENKSNEIASFHFRNKILKTMERNFINMELVLIFATDLIHI